ncbi:HipA family kinase, partial [Rhizobiaceae sp. 2RAB30]
DAVFCGAANLGSLDTNEGCFCGDAGTFVIKKTDAHPSLPHCEWFCSSLANICGVPLVPFSVIRHPDGNYWFGSQWMNGKTKDWWNLAQQGSINFAALADDLSRIYAFDLFIHNVDRHANNYMVVPHGGGHRVYSFDYSRAWLFNGFPPPQIMANPEIATVNVKNAFTQLFGPYLNVGAASQVLDNIDALGVNSIT